MNKIVGRRWINMLPYYQQLLNTIIVLKQRYFYKSLLMYGRYGIDIIYFVNGLTTGVVAIGLYGNKNGVYSTKC